MNSIRYIHLTDLLSLHPKNINGYFVINTKRQFVGQEMTSMRNPGRDISFPIFIRKEIETRKLERKSKQKISRLIDLLYRLNDIISR